MLSLSISQSELYDEAKEEFVTVKPTLLRLEHSLRSISKWESKYKRAFLSKTPMTHDELSDYVRMMTLDEVDQNVYYALTTSHYERIMHYIEDPMTATTFSDVQDRHFNNQVITSEIVYHWMVALGIPFECQDWHLNRLLVLIRVCSIKSSKPKKMAKGDILRRNRELNEQRRKQYNTRG